MLISKVESKLNFYVYISMLLFQIFNSCVPYTYSFRKCSLECLDDTIIHLRPKIR